MTRSFITVKKQQLSLKGVFPANSFSSCFSKYRTVNSTVFMLITGKPLKESEKPISSNIFMLTLSYIFVSVWGCLNIFIKKLCLFGRLSLFDLFMTEKIFNENKILLLKGLEDDFLEDKVIECFMW